MENLPVNQVDIHRYAGKWYTLYSIPTFLSEDWREITETFIIHPDGYFAVFTTYSLKNENRKRHRRSKLFVVKGNGNAKWKAQVIWPFKRDYWVIELAEDYSYAVVGHPKHKYLMILSRRPSMDTTLIHEIMERCRLKGYDINKLVFQEHKLPVEFLMR